jgi:prepilin-type N-terminal cleavage/methylation domain-containing protein
MKLADSGFSLIEVLIALLVLALGVALGAELIRLAAQSSSLAGAQGAAATCAENKMSVLRDSYRQDPQTVDLNIGTHGPEEILISNPSAGRILNRFQVSWRVDNVPDPRPGKALEARRIQVTVLPVDAAGSRHDVSGMNKVVVLSSIVSGRSQ